MMDRLQTLLKQLGPARTTFVASLLLSWIAVQGRLVNRDGIYYLDTARTLLEQGFAGLSEVVGFNFFPLLLASIATGIPIDLETLAKVLNGLFLAGACTLLVVIVRQREPKAAWAAVLVLLAIPAYNQYRHEVLREYGFWFFSLLGLWLAMRWADNRNWRDILLCQLSIAVAALFRLEAIVFFLALILWQGFAAPQGDRLRSVLAVVAMPAGLLGLTVVLAAAGIIGLPERVAYYLTAANPLHKVALFTDAASRLSDTVLLNKYSREEAVFILLVGLLAIIPLKFFKMMGLLLVPLLYRCKDGGFRKMLEPWQPLPWVFAVYVLVLAAFVTHQMFLVGRYVSMLNLLAVPLMATGLAAMFVRFPRWKLVMVMLALIMIVANVISLSPRQTQILEEASWLRQNVNETTRVGVENDRLPYYAGWRLSRAKIAERQVLLKELANQDLDMVAFEVKHKKENDEQWLKQNGLVEIQRFTGPKDDFVIIVIAEPS